MLAPHEAQCASLTGGMLNCARIAAEYEKRSTARMATALVCDTKVFIAVGFLWCYRYCEVSLHVRIEDAWAATLCKRDAFYPQCEAQVEFLEFWQHGQVEFLHSSVAYVQTYEVGEVAQEVVVADNVLASAVAEVQLCGLCSLAIGDDTVLVDVAWREAACEGCAIDHWVLLRADEDGVFGDGSVLRDLWNLWHGWEFELCPSCDAENGEECESDSLLFHGARGVK